MTDVTIRVAKEPSIYALSNSSLFTLNFLLRFTLQNGVHGLFTIFFFDRNRQGK